MMEWPESVVEYEESTAADMHIVVRGSRRIEMVPKAQADAAIRDLKAMVEERAVNIREVTAFIQPGGYNEALALRVLTDPVVHGFAWVADQEHKRAEKAEAEVERLKKLFAHEAAKNFQYEAERAEPGRLQTEVERLKWMLGTALDDLGESMLGPMSDADRAAILADLDRRWNERE